MQTLKKFLATALLVSMLGVTAMAGETSTPPGETNTPPGETHTPPGETNSPPGSTQGPGFLDDLLAWVMG